eukprot:Polyplicarium_translucidae@DN3398_c4_g1_i9.p1
MRLWEKACFLIGAASASQLKIAAYWGQNSAHHAGGTEPALFPACENWDHVMVAFILPASHATTPYEINHAGHGGWQAGGGGWGMEAIASDVSKCRQAGTKVLISIGGETAVYADWNGWDQAEHAQLIFEHFISPGTANPYGVPFDGVDLNIENSAHWGEAGWIKWSEKFRALMDANGGDLLLTSAPQSPEVRGMMNSAHIGLGTLENPDVITNEYIQFYNNPGSPAYEGGTPFSEC